MKLSLRWPMKRQLLEPGMVHLFSSRGSDTSITGLKQAVNELDEPAESPAIASVLLLLHRPAEVVAWAVHGGAPREDHQTLIDELRRQIVSLAFASPSHCKACELEQLRLHAHAVLEASDILYTAYKYGREQMAASH